MLGNIKVAQLISLIFILSGLVVFFWPVIQKLIGKIKDNSKKENNKEVKPKVKKKRQG